MSEKLLLFEEVPVGKCYKKIWVPKMEGIYSFKLNFPARGLI
jgi:hypothetical protein